MSPVRRSQTGTGNFSNGMKQELLIATKNKKKLKEIKDILSDLKLRITSLADYSSNPRIIENGNTFKKKRNNKSCKNRKIQKKVNSGRGFRYMCRCFRWQAGGLFFEILREG